MGTFERYTITSIKATIRAWLAPEHRLTCSSRLWRRIVAELERRGRRRHESGGFLLGVEHQGRRCVTQVLFYDELDDTAYASGVCILHGNAFAKLWELCRQKKLMVVADVHTHPGTAFQSDSDKCNPMVATAGHVAIIVSNFASWPIPATSLGIYEYRGQHTWIDRGPSKTRAFFYTGFWS